MFSRVSFGAVTGGRSFIQSTLTARTPLSSMPLHTGTSVRCYFAAYDVAVTTPRRRNATSAHPHHTYLAYPGHRQGEGAGALPQTSLRCPQFGFSTIVGRKSLVAKLTCSRATERPPPFPETSAKNRKKSRRPVPRIISGAITSYSAAGGVELAKGMGAVSSVHESVSPSRGAAALMLTKLRSWRLVELFGQASDVKYNSEGVPIGGPLFQLPILDLLRVLLAMLAAATIISVIFTFVQFELIYYGIWQVAYKKDTSAWKRLVYYGSSAFVAGGLVITYNYVFMVTSTLVGRGKFGKYMVQCMCASVLPWRVMQWRFFRVLFA